MKISLLNYTMGAEQTIAQAGKLCYSKVGVEDIKEKLDEDSIKKYINMLISMGHLSPVEHASFTFAVEGVSRSLTHQLVRHRIASYSQQSQRYVKFDDFDYIIPPAIDNNESAKKLYIETMEKCNEAYLKISQELFDNYYKINIEDGLDEKKARSKAEKSAIEDARYVFPNASESKIVFTMNARSLLHFFSLRCCNRAQWEIREMAFEMVKICKEIYPNLFQSAGPNCVNGPCPEGKMTCGKINEVRKKYKNI
ncbi:FAD-dependent thymidylate synthase [Anaerococcus sp. ENR0831]|uniref:Flavin-dependent thymidylate synthase n=1 Tax=Anaerococcus martiniensis TaxID=3115615 RepID=A0ABW9M7Y6_9FIRM